MFRINYDHFFDTNPNDAVVGTSAPTVARRYTRGSRSAQINHTAVVSSNLLNEARFAFLDGAPVTLWEAQNPSTAYTRTGSVPFTIGESRASDISSRQFQLTDTVSWSRGSHNLRFGGSLTRHTSGGSGSEPGQATLGTFTFLSTTTAPFNALTLADVQQYSQPVSYGITSYDMKQWMSVAFVQDRFRINDQFTVDADGRPRRLRGLLHPDSRQRAGERAHRRSRRHRHLHRDSRSDRFSELSHLRAGEHRPAHAAAGAAAGAQHHHSGRAAPVLHAAVRQLRLEL
jgi:hypothetical protein